MYGSNASLVSAAQLNAGQAVISALGYFTDPIEDRVALLDSGRFQAKTLGDELTDGIDVYDKSFLKRETTERKVADIYRRFPGLAAALTHAEWPRFSPVPRADAKRAEAVEMTKRRVLLSIPARMRYLKEEGAIDVRSQTIFANAGYEALAPAFEAMTAAGWDIKSQYSVALNLAAVAGFELLVLDNSDGSLINYAVPAYSALIGGLSLLTDLGLAPSQQFFVVGKALLPASIEPNEGTHIMFRKLTELLEAMKKAEWEPNMQYELLRLTVKHSNILSLRGDDNGFAEILDRAVRSGLDVFQQHRLMAFVPQLAGRDGYLSQVVANLLRRPAADNDHFKTLVKVAKDAPLTREDIGFLKELRE